MADTEKLELLDTQAHRRAEGGDTVGLKPCPFCGSDAKLVILDYENSDTTHWHKIMCKEPFKCGAELGTAISFYQPDYDEEVARLVGRWNRRANDE